MLSLIIMSLIPNCAGTGNGRGSNKEKVQTGTSGSGTRVEEDLNAASRNGTHDPPSKSKLTVLITESNETHMQTRIQIKTETDYGEDKRMLGSEGIQAKR